MFYESTETWKEVIDYLRCTPSFHGHSRNDGVLVKKEDGFFFAKLLFIFTCTISEVIYPLALVETYEVPRRLRIADRDLGLFRVQQRSNNPWEFIPATSIIRGAYLVDNPDKYGEALVLDTIDSDMYLRCQTIFI